MYRFKRLQDYYFKIQQLNKAISELKNTNAAAQEIVDIEMLKLSYLIEKNDFENNYQCHFYI